MVNDRLFAGGCADFVGKSAWLNYSTVQSEFVAVVVANRQGFLVP